MDATRIHARAPTSAKADSLRSTPAGAIWEALPVRDQYLLLWLLSADIATAQIAALLVYGQFAPVREPFLPLEREHVFS